MAIIMPVEKYKRLNPYSNEIPNRDHPLYEGNKERHDKWYKENRARLIKEMDDKFARMPSHTDKEIEDAFIYGGCL
jgi:hypothetical protein